MDSKDTETKVTSTASFSPENKKPVPISKEIKAPTPAQAPENPVEIEVKAEPVVELEADKKEGKHYRATMEQQVEDTKVKLLCSMVYRSVSYLPGAILKIPKYMADNLVCKNSATYIK